MSHSKLPRRGRVHGMLRGMASAITTTPYAPISRLERAQRISEMSLAEYGEQRTELMWEQFGYAAELLRAEDVAWLERMCTVAGLQPDSWRVRA